MVPMIRQLDYIRARTTPRISPTRASTPRLAALAFVALFILGWWAFFAVVPIGIIDTHFTGTPQDYPEFRLTPWRPLKSSKGSTTTRLTRDAIMPLAMHTLRYIQVTDDAGATIETTEFRADVRWGPTSIALIATGLLPFVVYFGLRKALRIESHFAKSTAM